jgi:ParB family chromosome partitioning protein
MRHDLHFVEHLSTRLGAPVGRSIPIDQIEVNPAQPRVEIGDLTELAVSIREKGILEPLLVRPMPGGRYIVISGERRLRAARQVGLLEIPCIEFDVDDAEAMEIALIENLQRKDLTPFEEADGLLVLVERFGYTHEQVAVRVGKSRSSVTETLTLAALPEEIRAECRRADIRSKSVLLQIARQPDTASMHRFINRVQVQGATRDDLRRERSTPRTRRKPYVYRYRGSDYVLEVRFRRAKVPKQQLIESIEEAIKALKPGV